MLVRRAFASGLLVLLLGIAAPTAGATGLAASGPSTIVVSTVVRYPNCLALNKVYRHGVGKPGARDHVSGSSRPVTTFTRSLAVYNANTGRDRDRDGIACEKL
jgi:hypothetical protein